MSTKKMKYCQNNPENSYTEKKAKHKPSGYPWCSICSFDDTRKFRGAVHDICNLRYKVPKEIPIVFHIGSTYDYHFIIKKLAEEFKGELECLEENTEKYINFSVPLKKENDNGKKITYKLNFIDCYRFMSTSLSNFVDNL